MIDMKRTVSSADLKAMSPAERQEAIGALVAAANSVPNGELTDIESKITALEARYDLSSEMLRERVSSGQQRETDEICDWLMLVNMREMIAPLATRPD